MIANPLKVRELLDEIERNQVLLPEIQRAYVWKGPQAAKLIDSLYREYPAGQILLWDTANLPITKSLDGVGAQPLPAVGQPKIVLDGQQRLTSLFKALSKDKDDAKDEDAEKDKVKDKKKAGNGEEGRRIDVYFHLESEQFQLYLRRLDADPRWVSVRSVVNGDKHDLDILAEIESKGGPGIKDPKSKVYLDRLQRLRKIGEFKFPIEVFKSDDYEQVTELFVRINAGGTRLRAAELALAQLALRLPGAIVERIDEALDDYADVGYELDPRFLTRALIAIGTGQSRFRHLTEFWRKPPSEIESIWTQTRKALNSAVNFVRQNARFEASEWLPTLNAIHTLAAYFHRHPAVTPDVEEGLLRWFYLASLRGRYSGSGETAMDEDLKAVAGPEPIAELMRNAVPAGHRDSVAPEEFDDAGERNPLFAMTYAVARKRSAKDWFTGVALAKDVVGADHEIEVHHIFPKAILKKAKMSRKDRDEIANLAFLASRPNKKIRDRPPAEYLGEIADKHPHRLEAQSIPMDPSLWEVERYQDFLAARRELLAKAVSDLIEDPV
jgi:hypothetical protein